MRSMVPTGGMALLVFCAATANAAPHQGVELERIVAVVNDEVVLASELEREIDGNGSARAALDEIVGERLLVQQAVSDGLRVSSAKVDGAILQIKNANGLSDKGLSEKLREQGYTDSEYRDDVRRQIARMRAINMAVRRDVVVTDSDVARRYKAYKTKASDGTLQPLGAVKNELRDAIFKERVAQATAAWIEELRRGAYIDIRL